MKTSIICIIVIIFSMHLYSQEVLNYGDFGKIYVYRSQTKPSGLVIFASGEDGWTKIMGDMSLRLSLLKNVTIAGINTRSYIVNKEIKGATIDQAADLEYLAKYIETKTGFDGYIKPVLAGYSSGAALVFSALSQSQAGTFAGALSVAFQPDISSNADFIKGSGLEYDAKSSGKIRYVSFKPSLILKDKWIVLQGQNDEIFSYEKTKDFTEKSGGEISGIKDAGHKIEKESLWIDAVLSSYDRLSPSKKEASVISDLPLVEEHFDKSFDKIAVILTGDGGWTTIDREIGNYLSQKGYAIIGFNTLQYFWKKRDPDITGKDVERVINFYHAKYNIKIILIGYSLGADVLPFVLTRLQNGTLQKLKCAVFLGIANTVSFEFHVTDWIAGSKQNIFNILPEVEKIKDVRTIFLGGEKESDTLLPRLDKKKYEVIVLSGGHHFDNNYAKIADIIVNFAK